MLSTVAKTHFVLGVRRCLALAVGALPFGLVFGVAVAQSDVNDLVGILASVLVVAGASQITLLELHETGAVWYVALGTALVINARFVLYSAALSPSFQEHSRGWRLFLSYLMTDQAATLSLQENEFTTDPMARRWYYLGAGITLWSFWQAGTIVGVLGGASLPDSLQLEFIIPLMFTALVVPALRNRPAVAAAVVSAAVTIACAGFPPGTNILAGAFAGIAAGTMLRTPETASTAGESPEVEASGHGSDEQSEGDPT